MTTKPLTHADECELVLVELANQPTSLEELAARTKLSYWRVNQIVTELRLKGRVDMLTERLKGRGKVIFYTLRIKAA